MEVARYLISAGLIPKLVGGWRSLRRNIATEWKGVSRRDLAHLGGWNLTETIAKCYQRDDEATLSAALAARRLSTAAGLVSGERTPRMNTTRDSA